MKSFMADDFLLETKASKKLYFSYAVKMPIFDYHNHLPAQDISEKRRYDNITRVWLAQDQVLGRSVAMKRLGLLPGQQPPADGPVR